ncbi:MAG TPA: esterase-like activity of phytase family protein [Pseudonocardia sp.]|nr:esterase-like activity of phytase family protein [Pseudonocardia sp.]
MRAFRLVIAPAAIVVALGAGCAPAPTAMEQPVPQSPSPVAATQEPAALVAPVVTAPAFPAAVAKMAGNATLARMPLSSFEASTVPGAPKLADFGLSLGSIGSDVYPADAPDEYWMVTDRGPNGKMKVAKHVKHRTMPVPGFDPSIVRVKTDGGSMGIVQTIPLTTTDGRPVTGLPNSARDERMYDNSGVRALPYNPSGVDTEAIVRTATGEFWLSDEYGPSIMKVSPEGRILARYVPQGTASPDAGYPEFDTLPGIMARRADNRGIESLAISPDGRTLYAAMQSPLSVPSLAAGNISRSTRLIALDTQTGRPTAEYVYGMEIVNSFDRRVGGDQSEMKISGMSWYGPNELLVDERTDNVARLYRIIIDPSRNILGGPYDDPKTSPSLEQSLPAPGKFIPLDKVLAVDLPAKIPGMPGKIEGVAVRDPRTIVVTNDNDFGIPDGKEAYVGRRLQNNGTPNRLMVVNLG